MKFDQFDPDVQAIAITVAEGEQARKDARKRFEEREQLKPMVIKKGDKVYKTPFKQGDHLRSEFSFAPNLGPNFAQGKLNLREVIDPKLQSKVDKDFSDKGLAATVAHTDTAAGVREIIEYDINEREVIESMTSGGGGAYAWDSCWETTEPDPDQIQIINGMKEKGNGNSE